MLLVVSSLTALINDQINSCERHGLKSCKLEDFKLGILGLDSKLYPGNMQRILNKDLTRFMQSLSPNAKIKQTCKKKGSASRVGRDIAKFKSHCQ